MIAASVRLAVLVPLISVVVLNARAAAEVRRVEIATRTDVMSGHAFGKVGHYQLLVGKIYFAVDPQHARNQRIVDLDKAPRNANGEVEFSSDLIILTPADPARGNGVVLFDGVNRGSMITLQTFNRAENRTAEPKTEADLGDGFLMREGYTVVAVGWESAPSNPRIALSTPIATDNGKAITGWISNWFIPSNSQPTFDLLSSFWTGFRNYPPLAPQSSSSRLTERVGYFGEPRVVPRKDWFFGRLENGQVHYDPRYLTVSTGLKPGHTYEVTYETKDPRVSGLGLAALSDAASYFKYRSDAPVHARYAYAYGTSQTGRFLRAVLYEGFTTDERGRQALDALYMDVPGASLGSYNKRFAQPNEGGFFTTSPFPYLYQVTRDPSTGRVDGLGARVPEGQAPKIVIANSSFEYWGNSRAAALNHVSLDGAVDMPEAENVRVYLYAGAQHTPGTLPPPDTGAQTKGNSNDYRFASRALLTGLDRWVQTGEVPPPSLHPRLSDGTLVPHAAIKFPRVARVRWPYDVPKAYRPDLPGPLHNNPLPFLLPKVDQDGNETSGIRLPDVAVPLATYSGWAFRSEAIGAPTELLPIIGSYIPFARTRAERTTTGDSRKSIAERYSNRTAYLQQVEAYARKLAKQRYMLSEDVELAVARAGRHWDLVMNGGNDRRD